MIRALRPYGWVLLVAPLAGAAVSAASFAFCMAVADRVLALDVFDDHEEAAWL